jgi:radical SAM protein with 4Fe4S-binding SPASM domain
MVRTSGQRGNIRVSKRVGLDYRIRKITATSVFADFDVDGMMMNTRCHDFGVGKEGFDRGMSLDWMTDSAFIRNDPCSFVFRNFTMDYDGNVMPCCNLRSDIAEHKPFILGNVTGSSIFDIYADQKFIDWRRSLAGFSEKAGPCRHCRDAPLASLADRIAVAIWDKTSRQHA